MKSGLKVKWWEWLLLAVVVESLIPTKNGRTWLVLAVLAAILSPILDRSRAGPGKSGQTGLAGGDYIHFSMQLEGVQIGPNEWWDAHWIKGHTSQTRGSGRLQLRACSC